MQYSNNIFWQTIGRSLVLIHSSTITCWPSPFSVILGVADLICGFYSIFDRNSCLQTMQIQTRHMWRLVYVASGLGPHCLPMTLLQVPDKNGYFDAGTELRIYQS